MSVAVFDLYGTLLDFTSLGARVAAAGIPDAEAFVAAWRRKQIEYAFCTTLAGVWHDFDVITVKALDHVIETSGLTVASATRTHLAALWNELPAYDDVQPALQRLAERGVQRYVLTNGVQSSARDAVERAGLRPLLTDVLSVETVRAYKPDPRVYAMITTRTDLARDAIVFISSNGWDAAGAATFGFRVVWCNRRAAAAETLFTPPSVIVRSLAEIEPLFAAADA